MSADWTAWLGPAADEMTDEQRARFEAEAERIVSEYDDLDLAIERDEALSAVVQYLLGEDSLDEVGRRRTAAKVELASASRVAREWVLLSIADGMPEAEAARRSGVDRMQVRKWQGK